MFPPLQVKAQGKSKLNNKEKKAALKIRAARKARGEEVTSSEEEV